MYSLKAFLKIDSLTNNQPNVVAPIGELSDLGYTYSKNKGFYTDVADHPGFEYVAFTSKSDDTGAEQDTLLIARIKEFLFKTSHWMNSTAAGMPQYFNGPNGTQVFLTEWQSAIDGWAPSVPNQLDVDSDDYDDVQILGVSPEYTLVSGINKYFVHWVEFNIDYLYNTTLKTAHVKIWLSDAAFREQYDDYEIVVVPFVNDLDDFFDTYSQVNILVNDAKNPNNIVSRFETAKGEHPSTIQKVLTYNWHDDLVPPNLIPTPWGVLIYGIAGDNLDAIREELREYILDHSSHTEEEWGEIFPGIFRVNEFLLIPMWHRYSIPNATLLQGIYSPVVQLNRDKTLLNTICPNLDMEWIEDHAESFVYPYKSVAIYSIPSNFNNEDLHILQAAIPNWAHISTDTYDFSRMNIQAQEWANKMENAIITAESITAVSTVPSGYSRVYRNNIMFVALEINERTYLVCAKKYFKDHVPEILASDEPHEDEDN